MRAVTLGPDTGGGKILETNVKPIELGGDYLSLPNDAALEMHQLTAEGHPIGYGLRYTRPTFVPFRVGGVIDAMLYHRLVVN